MEGAFAWDLSYLRAAGIQPLAESQRSTVLNDTDAENFPSAAEASGVKDGRGELAADLRRGLFIAEQSCQLGGQLIVRLSTYLYKHDK